MLAAVLTDRREERTMVSKTAADLVADARADIENLSVEQVAKEADQDGVVVVDLREAEEIAATGRIPGAVHIPRGMLEFRADPASPYHDGAFDPAARTVLYCASGGRSALAAAALGQLGYVDVAHLAGGFAAWTEAGQPVET
jgi:rhodanese-related sulfurtransferase